MYEDTWAAIEQFVTTGNYISTRDLSNHVKTAAEQLTKETIGKLLTYQLKLQERLRKVESTGSVVAIEAAKIRCQTIYDLIQEAGIN